MMNVMYAILCLYLFENKDSGIEAEIFHLLKINKKYPKLTTYALLEGALAYP
jgi:hypothetical protein